MRRDNSAQAGHDSQPRDRSENEYDPLGNDSAKTPAARKNQSVIAQPVSDGGASQRRSGSAPSISLGLAGPPSSHGPIGALSKAQSQGATVQSRSQTRAIARYARMLIPVPLGFAPAVESNKMVRLQTSIMMRCTRPTTFGGPIGKIGTCMSFVEKGSSRGGLVA